MQKVYLEKPAIALVLIVVIWTILAGAFSDVIDVDAAQYAALSMEMLLNNSFLIITERSVDYLDKPPFLFWINCLSFAVFGFTNFAYKLPSLLFSIITVLYTYKLGAYLYDKKTRKVAAVILATSIGFIWANNDVKTDAIVTTCVVFSVYHLILFFDKNHLAYLVLASIGIGIGMLTKGPMGLIFPFAIIFIHALSKKKFHRFFRFQWLLLPVIVLIVLSPMLWGLYHQFDLHPEKVINGKTNVSGLRFFFWEQSFGRITGENAWKNNTSFFYLFHTLLLLIFPYSILVVVAYVKKIRFAIQQKYWGEANLVGGSLLILTAISLSSYKIPHYTIVIFPFVAIIAANALLQIVKAPSSNWIGVHNKIIAAIVFVISILSFVCFDFSWMIAVLLDLLLILQVHLLQKSKHLQSLFITAITLGFIFNAHIVPSLQQYAPGRRFAELIQENNLTDENIYFFNRNSRAMEFYLHKRLKQLSWEELLALHQNHEDAWYYMSLDGKEALLYAGLQVERELELLQYDLNRISLGFLNPLTREEHLEPRFLIKFKPAQ